VGHDVLHVTASPVHGSVHVAPQYPTGHSTAGVQHWELPDAEHTCEPQLPAQLTGMFVQGSVNVPQ
jgi:hypothetical protein